MNTKNTSSRLIHAILAAILLTSSSIVLAHEACSNNPPSNNTSHEQESNTDPCYNCSGSGTVHWTVTCQNCDGVGGFICNVCQGNGGAWTCYPCKDCNETGQGVISSSPCPYCDGLGGYAASSLDPYWIQCTACWGDGLIWNYEYCYTCNGSGDYWDWQNCYECGGTGGYATCSLCINGQILFSGKCPMCEGTGYPITTACLNLFKHDKSQLRSNFFTHPQDSHPRNARNIISLFNKNLMSEFPAYHSMTTRTNFTICSCTPHHTHKVLVSKATPRQNRGVLKKGNSSQFSQTKTLSSWLVSSQSSSAGRFPSGIALILRHLKDDYTLGRVFKIFWRHTLISFQYITL
jgi:hypothetical protein